jgi:ERCC4-type nuclease
LAYLTTELAEIRIIHTKNAMDTALLLSRLAKREQLDRKASLPVLKEAYKAKDLSEAQLRVVASLPGIGARTGLKLLKDLETPEAVMTADEMKFAEYVGRKRARKIKEVLTEPFERAERIF